MTDYDAASLRLHAQHRGKIEMRSKVPLVSHDDLSVAYTPGVAEPCRVIAADPARARDLTIKGNSVAIVSDGSAVLGLGNIGPHAALPVMEGKALLFKEFAGIDAWPLCLDTQETDEIIRTVRAIAPTFAGINLEDIAAPRCFEIEASLQDLGIPVFHDDQHGTAIVLLAALLNAHRVVKRDPHESHVVINGAGAAGTAIAKLLRCVDQDTDACVPVADIVICDSKGIIHRGRTDLSPQKQQLLSFTNRDDRRGTMHDAIAGAHVFIGVSRGNLLKPTDVASMASDPIILAMANPTPEIMPDEAARGGAAVVGTGRSDFPNQVNNVLAFPGLFRGALDVCADRITAGMQFAAAHALAEAVSDVSASRILPDPLDRTVATRVAAAVADAWCPDESHASAT